MMNTVEEFTNNYGGLHDAIINNISLNYNAIPIGLTITVVINCMSLIKDDEWVNVKIDFSSIDEFRINAAKNFSFEIVENFSIFQYGGGFLFNFYPMTTTPETIEEHRDSMFYVMSHEIEFEEIHLKD